MTKCEYMAMRSNRLNERQVRLNSFQLSCPGSLCKEAGFWSETAEFVRTPLNKNRWMNDSWCRWRPNHDGTCYIWWWNVNIWQVHLKEKVLPTQFFGRKHPNYGATVLGFGTSKAHRYIELAYPAVLGHTLLWYRNYPNVLTWPDLVTLNELTN